MNEARWAWFAVQFAMWGAAFVGLLFLRRWVERLMIALLHRRRTVFRAWHANFVTDGRVRGMVLLRHRAMENLALVVALVAGSAVPLAPDVRLDGLTVAWHLWGGVGFAVLPAVALLWASFFLLASSYGWRVSGEVAAGLVLNALPTALLALASVTWQRAGGEGGAAVTWALRLFGLPLWAACLAPPRPSPQVRGGFAWQVQALSSALLVGQLALGGWGGTVWWGLACTTFRVVIVTGLWTLGWVAFSAPRLPLGEHLTGRVIVPLAVINLLLSISWLVVGGRL